jgi:raffinose/stachyose/melibiose transport system permease protein
MAMKSKQSRSIPKSIATHALLFAWAVTTVLPLLWVFINSFKSSNEMLRNSMALPSSLDFKNYATLMSYPDVSLPRSFLNSFIISGSVVLGALLLSGMAAFALSRIESKASKYVESLLVACLLAPSFATIIPNFVTVSRLSFMKDTYLTAIVPQISGNLCFTIILLTGFMRSIPYEIDEAAVMDGASAPLLFWQIAVPLSKPMFATVSIMVFIASYNDLLTSMVYLSRQALKPVCVILSMVSNMFGTDYGAMMAAIFITMLPLMLLYTLAQEQVLKGLTAGATKG